MKLYKLLLPAVLLFLFSCNTKPVNNFPDILNTGQLSSQIFSLNTHRDTVLLTKGGCIIRLPKESLQSDNVDIKLEVKEAVTNTDIVLAGLTTMSGKQFLSSGGMIFINAANGYKVSIKKQLEILVPTKKYNSDMSVFKGVDSAGMINWTDPESLPKDSTILSIENGKTLFKANCANCHKLKNDYTGPEVAGITHRRNLQWIYEFIHNPGEMIRHNADAKKLATYWKPTVMTAFPALTHYDINNILAYIETSANKNWKAPDSFLKRDSSYDASFLCIDSCYKYQQALDDLEYKKSEIEDSTEDFFTLDRTIIIVPQNRRSTKRTTKIPEPQNETNIPEKEIEHVTPTSITATFYTINVKTFGWTNIDILLKDISSCSPSELFVNLKTKYKTDFQVLLIVPSVKAFVQGGKLNDQKQFGFDETNGKIPLPQNAQCYIIAFAEVDGKLIFGKKEFYSSQKQTIDLSFTETTKEALTAQIKALNLDGVSAEVNDSKNTGKLKEIEKKSSETEKLKPVNCDCGIPANTTNLPGTDVSPKK